MNVPIVQCLSLLNKKRKIRLQIKKRHFDYKNIYILFVVTVNVTIFFKVLLFAISYNICNYPSKLQLK